MSKNIFNKFLSVKYLIRIDDLAPNLNWQNYHKVKKILNEYNIKPILGVIPNNKDSDLLKFPLCEFDFFEEIRKVRSLGWKIAMHGYEHKYVNFKGKDFLSMGRRTEFSGKKYDLQYEMIKNGMDIFLKNSIFTDIFFAPNHNFDLNTIKALKKNNIQYVLDGYGLAPFRKYDLTFVPQMFGKAISMPFGLHTSVHHLNNYSEKDLIKLTNFIKKNQKNIIDFDTALNFKNNLLYSFLGFIIGKILILKRKLFSMVQNSSS